MTTILAVQGKGWAVVGFDSRISTDDTNRVSTLGRGVEKVAKNGDYLIGAAGDVRAINILSYSFNPPKPDDNIGLKLDRFMTTRFIPALRKCFEDQGYAVKSADSEEGTAIHGSTILVVVNGVIYEIDSDYAWARDTYGLYGAGSGGDYALGALHGLFGKNSPSGVEETKIEVRKALEVGAKLDAASGAPFHILFQAGPAERRRRTAKKKKAKQRRRVRRKRKKL